MEAKLRALKRGAAWLMLVPVRELYENGSGYAKKTKTAEEWKNQLLSPGPW